MEFLPDQSIRLLRPSGREITVRYAAVVVDIDNAEGAWLGFETLTFVPLDRRLVDKGLLTQSEVEWWNAYHAQVRAILAPQLEGGDLEWLEAECAAL